MAVVVEYEKDFDDPEIYKANGIDHYIMTNMGEFLTVWQVGSLEVSISGVPTREELVKMIDSIYED